MRFFFQYIPMTQAVCLNSSTCCFHLDVSCYNWIQSRKTAMFLKTIKKAMWFSFVVLHSWGWQNCCWSQRWVCSSGTNPRQLWGQTQRGCCWAESPCTCGAECGGENWWWRRHLQQDLSGIAEGDKWEQQQQCWLQSAERLVFKVFPLQMVIVISHTIWEFHFFPQTFYTEFTAYINLLIILYVFIRLGLKEDSSIICYYCITC